MTYYPGQRDIPLSFDASEQSRIRVRFFNMVYSWMSVGLVVTGAVAWLISQNTSLINTLYSNYTIATVGSIGAFLLAMYVQMRGLRMPAAVGLALFMLYAMIIGALISYIFVIYPMATIGSAFLITGGTFAGLSIFGFVTKRDLSGMGGILVMAMWGLILASVVNLFVASSALSWILTYGILAVFIGIVAWKTQELKQIADATADNPTLAGRFAVIGSLQLYIAFINIFISILRILGDRR